MPGSVRDLRPNLINRYRPRQGGGYFAYYDGMRLKFFGCYILAAMAMIGATAYMIYGTDKALGILLVIVAVIMARVLVLTVAERLTHIGQADKRAADAESSQSNDRRDT